MQPPLFAVHLELAGWDLLWARLEAAPGAFAAGQDAYQELERLRAETAERARHRFGQASLAEDPTAAAVRALFRAAGCDPTRYRPSSEALIRRLLKGEPLPAIHPLVDLNNCLSVELAVPCAVAAEGAFAPPVTLRAGSAGESFESLRGPFNLEGKPLLADGQGPFSTPITDSQRIKVRDDTRLAWLAAYLPRDVVSPETAGARLAGLLGRVPAVSAELAASRA